MLKNKWLIFLVLAPLLGICASALHVYYYLHVWVHPQEEIIFEIRPGENFAQINRRLAQEKLIASARLFHHYAKFLNCLTKFRAGHFKIPPRLNMVDLMNTLLNARSYYSKVTIPEGKNLYEIAEILEKNSIISAHEFINAAKLPVYLSAHDLELPSAEGYLYPETYFFSPHTPAPQLIRAMMDQFVKSTQDLDFSQSPLAFDQLITLASIVEKETGAQWERATIAGVFFNRLRKKMRLQSDPTTIYGIFEQYQGNLTRKDLETQTPYNTYRINGLPRGPICNPGVAAIAATLAPERHSYLYFVSRNDGTHLFTKNYQDHQMAVDSFQKDPSKRKNKSWRQLRQ